MREPMQVEDAVLAAIRARIPCLYLRTIEESRALRLVAECSQRVGSNGERPTLRVWSAASGVAVLRVGRDGQITRDDEQPASIDGLLDSLRSGDQQRIIQVLYDPWPHLGQPITARLFREALAAARGGVVTYVILSPERPVPPELRPDIYTVDLPLPSGGELEAYITNLARQYEKSLAGKLKVDRAAIPALARACQGLAFNEARNVVSLALVQRGALDADAVQSALEEKKQVVRAAGILEYEEAKRGLKAVGGLDNLKDWIGKRVGLFDKRARDLGIQAPRGVVLIGPPGTGKTLTGRAIAADWRVPLLRLNAGRLYEGLVGASEANLRTALRTAEAVAPCVLFVDEAEKAFSAAGAASGGDSGTSARILGELLSWLQDKTAPVFVVLTCNEPDLLPTALLRKGRFDEIFAVGLPGPVARAEILRIHWQVCGQSYEQSVPPELRAEVLRASQGFSGGELEVACQAAFIEAFWQNRSPTAADLLKALRRTVPLSQTLKEQVMLLEAWCKSGRAVPAASPDTGEAEQQAAVLDIPSA